MKGVAEVVQDGSLVGECSMETVGEFQEDVLDTGLAQSDSVIIRNCGLTDGYMIRKVLSKIEKGVPISSIWISFTKFSHIFFNKFRQITITCFVFN